jgi:ribulose-phosphate 3-epimerase
MALIAPSLLAADFARLGEALGFIKAAGASMVHVDVMDGHFVPDITVGQPVIASLRKATDLVLDVHLQVELPERYAAEFVDLGADRVCVPAEATPQLHRALHLIRSRGAKVGVAVNPATPVEFLADVLGELDYLTILTADPGGGKETFLPQTVAKVHRASRVRTERRLDFALQAEGGIDAGNYEELVRAGADILVMGSDIFHGKGDPRARLAEMVRLAAEVRQTSKV